MTDQYGVQIMMDNPVKLTAMKLALDNAYAALNLIASDKSRKEITEESI